nr:type II toxin-antitoxin system RelE/ParE family toxin [Rhizobium sp. FY34]
MADVRLSHAADADIRNILFKTHEDFGYDAYLRYRRLIATALRDLALDCRRPGSVLREDIAPDVCCYHLRHSRERARTESGIVRRPRHLILFRQFRPELIGVGRILHDAMEVSRHLPLDFGDL